MKASVFPLFFAAALAGCSCPPHTVKVSAGPALDGLRVSGQGHARGTPDVARATLGVEVRAATSEEATRQVGDRMQAVLAALKAQGVSDRDVRTEQISIFFEQEIRPPEPWPGPTTTPGKGQPEKGPAVPPKPEEPRGFYRASNTVEVTIRNLDNASAILAAATNAGANSMYGMRFELEDNKKVLAEAREKAVKDARANAEELARLSGVTLGPIVAINENPGFPGPVPMMMKAEAARSDASVPVERGELTVTTQVELVYSLEK